jgi:hypothetical protein
MKVCKFCGISYDIGHGSFCSRTCHAKYAVSKVKNHKCGWPGAYTNDGKEWLCPYCGETIIGTLNIRKHKSAEIKKYGYHLCKYCGEKFESSGKAGAHAIHCTKNPDYDELRTNINKKLSEAGKNCSLELRQHFSELAKKQGLGGYTFTKDGTRGQLNAKSGMYKGIWCDSAWELAYIVYNLEHNIYFEKNHKGFEYFSTYDNKIHKYYPDFLLDESTFVEIKGWMNESAKIKIEEFRKNNPDLKLIVLTHIEIKLYIDYVIDKYGEKYYEVLYEKL